MARKSPTIVELAIVGAILFIIGSIVSNAIRRPLERSVDVELDVGARGVGRGSRGARAHGHAAERG